MTFTRQERPGVFACGTALLTVAERDPHCTCTWIATEYDWGRRGESRFLLKCRHNACPAVTFHRRLDERGREA